MFRHAIALTAAVFLASFLPSQVSATPDGTVAAPAMLVPPLPRLSPLDSAAPGKAAKKSNLASLAEAKTAVVPFANSPFPYGGIIPDKQVPFIDVVDGGRRGHTSGRAGVYWESQTYSDRSVLLSFPKHFDLHRPAVIVVFFHGNEATLARDVVTRQQVVDQFAASGLNAVLLVPQFAVDALDSSAGNFWMPGFFGRFLDEAAAKLAKLYAAGATPAVFKKMPVILVAYSGGYDAAAYALAVGGATRRVVGVALLDALYGEEDKFIRWIAERRKSGFFFSAYSLSAADGNADVKARLAAQHIAFQETPPAALRQGTIAFIATDPAVVHGDFVTQAWVQFPLQWLLARVAGYPRPP